MLVALVCIECVRYTSVISKASNTALGVCEFKIHWCIREGNVANVMILVVLASFTNQMGASEIGAGKILGPTHPQ